MLLPSLLKSGDQVYQKVIKQLYQKMLLLNLLITTYKPTARVNMYINTLFFRIHRKLPIIYLLIFFRKHF